MDFDDMLEELGEMGKFQLTTYLLVCLPVFFAAANSLSYVFTAGVPKYRCYIPECDDPIHPQYEEPWISLAIPSKSVGALTDDYEASLCEKNQTYNNTRNFTEHFCTADTFTTEVIKCNEWVFDDERTIVSDWKITCLENQWMLSFIGTMHFAGIIVGSALFGILADRYGRKLMFIICIVIMAISGAAQAVSPEYVTFAVLVFINSVGTAGVYPLAFIIGVELVGRKKRETTGIVLNYFYAIGEAFVALVAWLTKDWVVLQLLVSAPAILFIGYYWLIPESVRWLLAKQKDQKAKGIVCRAAKMNGVTLSVSLMETFEKEQQTDPLKVTETVKTSDMLPVVRIMLRSKKLIIRFIIILFIWATNAFVYYGLSLNSTSMVGNKYINFALVCLIEIPGYTLAWLSIQYLGRRVSLVASLFLCGFTCIGSIFVPTDITWLVIMLFLIGKLGITSSFGVVFVYTAELLPTIIRSGGVGTSSTTARFGALLAPFVPLLGIYVQQLPMALFGIVSCIAGLLALKLPETLGKKLPETVEDAIKL